MQIIKILIFIIILTTTETSALENKIILKIDNEIITTLDVLDEIEMLKFFNKKNEGINNEELYEVALQSIIKREIKKNEIYNNNNQIELENDDYLNFLIKSYYENLGYKEIDKFKKDMSIKKIKFSDFKEMLIVDILWNKLIYLKFNEKIKINKDLLIRQIKEQNNQIKKFNLSEIIFQIDKATEFDATYQIIKNDINNIGFANAAIKHSISNSVSKGGKLGWINENQIDKEILRQVEQIPIGEISKPIRVQGGFLILKINDIVKDQKNLDLNEELKKLVNSEKNKQLNSFSNLYFNKVKKDLKINAP